MSEPERSGQGSSVGGRNYQEKGGKRKYFALSSEVLAERIAHLRSGVIALVFGNEEFGLNDRDLELCHLAVRIPSSPGFLSLNLSHAVQIVAYQIFRRLSETSAADYTLISNDRLESLVAVIAGSLEGIGFFTQVGPEDLSRFFRDILAREALSGREAERLGIVFKKISGLAAKKPALPLRIPASRLFPRGGNRGFITIFVKNR